MKTALPVVLSMLVSVSATPLFADVSTNLSSGVSIDFRSKESVSIGSNIVWSVTVSNSVTTSRTCIIQLDVDVVNYRDGTLVADYSYSIATNTLAANASATLSSTLWASNYAGQIGLTNSFGVSAIVQVIDSEDFWATVTHTTLVTPTVSNFFSLSPSAPIPVGNVVTASVYLLNPIPSPLHNVAVHFAADRGLSTNAALVESAESIGTVATNAYVSASVILTAGQVGTSTVWATIISDELLDGLTESRQVTVTE